MDKRKVYTAPEAEMILLAPVEGLAAWDWNFKTNWQNTWHNGLNAAGSAVGIINGGAGLDENKDFWGEDGFVIKK